MCTTKCSKTQTFHVRNTTAIQIWDVCSLWHLQWLYRKKTTIPMVNNQLLSKKNNIKERKYWSNLRVILVSMYMYACVCAYAWKHVHSMHTCTFIYVQLNICVHEYRDRCQPQFLFFWPYIFLRQTIWDFVELEYISRLAWLSR